ncbi:MAG: DUF1565 domain-containing protein [Ignavibacterium sp.]|jgi:hypothetical protein|nr:DUF1565 domain-containing protein [Ignavibacterium sp.]
MKIFTIVLILIIISCLTYANTIYVDDSNTTGIENGTLQYPFNTVTEGISAAIAGDTVYIFAGVYDETGQYYLYLKDGLVITGEDSSSVIINKGFRNPDATMIHYTEVSNVRFTEFETATGDGTATIVVKQCRFQFAGFSSASGYTYIIENCTIDDGIGNSSGECFLYIRNNIILNGGISDRGGAPPGIEVHIIENNIINNDGLSEPWESVIDAASQSITLLNNVIVCNGLGSGIIVSSGTPTNIIGNEITLNNGIPLNGTVGIETSSGEGIVTDNTISGGWVGYYSNSGATLFENNTITQSHIGFMSKGAEEVKYNTITNCSGDGMILMGLRGPISGNVVQNNDSVGIRLIRSVDLGGGILNGEGNNIIRNNGFYDLVINYQPLQPETLYIMNNGWDHITLPEILQYDIFNEGGSTNIIINATGYYTDVEEQDNLPTDFNLEQNYPNPFNPSTNIGFQISDGGFVSLKVYDVLGNEVATLVDEYKPAGSYVVEFNPASSIKNPVSGVYFYQLKAGNYIETKKMVLMK